MHLLECNEFLKLLAHGASVLKHSSPVRDGSCQVAGDFISAGTRKGPASYHEANVRAVRGVEPEVSENHRSTQQKAWEGVVESPLPGRLAKPRTQGLTMLIDKGLGLLATQDLLEVGADYVDYIKLAFGTSAFLSPAFLREKVALIRSFGVDVYPGGTFLEIALTQGRLDGYLKRARELGFNCIEVSDGTIDLDQRARSATIRAAADFGFRVITEVGKKDATDSFDPDAVLNQVESDLADGAYKVIVEGRESGRGVGIYDGNGQVKEDAMAALVKRLDDPGVLVWEAPLKDQQQELILLFGSNVNLGNVKPDEILALEALRCGLRGDTLKAALQAEGRSERM